MSEAVFRFHIDWGSYSRGTQLHISTKLGEKFDSVLMAPMAKRREPGEITLPFLEETYEESRDNVGAVTNFLQAALDAAWEYGLRPKGVNDPAVGLAELRATKGHLEDMRALVFKSDKP